MSTRLRDASAMQRLQAGLLVALVLLAPLGLGGVLPEARALLVVGGAALVALEWVPRVLRGEWPDRFERAWLGVWGVVMALLVIQVMPLPDGLADRLGATPAGLAAQGVITAPRISPWPAATLHHGAMATLYGAVVMAVAKLPARQVSHLALALVTLASLQAFYGAYALVHGHEHVLGLWPRVAHPDDATGTYLNRNHYAGLLALAWPVGIAQLTVRRGPLPPIVPAALFSLLVGLALVASHSRLGVLAALVGLATWALLSAHAGSPARLARGRHVAVFALAAFLLGTVWFGSGPLLERYLRLPHDMDRLVVWQALTDLPARTWILGAGAGAFADVFKTVQPAALAPSYHHAHGDWVELFVDFGVVGVASIATAAAWALRCTWPARLHPLQLGALGGVAAIGFHVLADFDLHVPGTALAFWVLVGITLNRELGGAGRRASDAV